MDFMVPALCIFRSFCSDYFAEYGAGKEAPADCQTPVRLLALKQWTGAFPFAALLVGLWEFCHPVQIHHDQTESRVCILGT